MRGAGTPEVGRRTGRAQRLGAVGVAALVACGPGLVGCGGGSSDRPDPPPSSTPRVQGPSAADRRIAAAAVLRLPDLGGGWRGVAGPRLSDRTPCDAHRGRPDHATARAMSPEFVQGESRVVATASLFRDEQAAVRAARSATLTAFARCSADETVRYYRQVARETGRPIDVTAPTITTLPAASAGDGTRGRRVELAASDANGTRQIVLQVVQTRVGRGIVALSALTSSRASFSDAQARTVRRLRSALGR